MDILWQCMGLWKVSIVRAFKLFNQKRNGGFLEGARVETTKRSGMLERVGFQWKAEEKDCRSICARFKNSA